eukprot:883871-Prymnesium_polylepis.1
MRRCRRGWASATLPGCWPAGLRPHGEHVCARLAHTYTSTAQTRAMRMRREPSRERRASLAASLATSLARPWRDPQRDPRRDPSATIVAHAVLVSPPSVLTLHILIRVSADALKMNERFST